MRWWSETKHPRAAALSPRPHRRPCAGRFPRRFHALIVCRPQTLDPIGRTQTDTFDGMGRETNDVSFTGVNTAWAYNNLSEVTTVTVGTGGSAETTTNTWDNLGRKTAVQDALSGTTQMAYDLNGFMTSLTDSVNNTTVWTRDNLERVTAEKNQLGYSRTYVWDSANNLTQETDRDGRVRNFSVNHLNQTTAEQWMNGVNVVNTISTAYNADGELTSAGDSFSSYALAYDGQGHLASVDNNGTPGVPDVVLTSQYDGQGDRTSLSATMAGVKDFLNSYSYDTLSRMTSVAQQSQTGGNTVAPKTIDFSLDGIGDITQIYRMNYVGMGPDPQTDPADTALAHNTVGQLTGITPSHNGTNIDPLSWTFDSLGRVATFGSSNGTATYGYDSTSQLTSVTYTGTGQPANESYSFDANGNQNETGHVVSPANQVTNDGTFTYAFDNEGNRTSRTRISSSYATDHTVTYSWDYRDRLTDVEYFDNNSVLTKHVHYVYGVFDHLIETEVDPTGGGTYTIVTHNVYDLSKPVVSSEDATQPVEPGLMISAAGNMVLQTNGSQQLTERILNGPITSAYDAFFTALAQEDIASGNDYWFLLNNQGSLEDVVDPNGNQVDHLVYTGSGSVFSESAPATPHIIGYTGGLTDAYTGLVNDWHRGYDPQATVWLSVDQSGFRAGDENLSRYLGNEPPRSADPTGLAPASILPSILPALLIGPSNIGAGTPPWWSGIDWLTPDQELILEMAMGDPVIEYSLLQIFMAANNVSVTWSEWWTQNGHCLAWANKAKADLLDLVIEKEIVGVGHTQLLYEYIGSFPLWYNHAFIEITLPNGFVFYIDNGYVGGADHIFFEIPPDLVARWSAEYQQYLADQELKQKACAVMYMGGR